MWRYKVGSDLHELPMIYEFTKNTCSIWWFKDDLQINGITRVTKGFTSGFTFVVFRQNKKKQLKKK